MPTAGIYTEGEFITLIFKLTVAADVDGPFYTYLGPIEMDAW
jgi:hypothetical protein